MRKIDELRLRHWRRVEQLGSLAVSVTMQSWATAARLR